MSDSVVPFVGVGDTVGDKSPGFIVVDNVVDADKVVDVDDVGTVTVVRQNTYMYVMYII